MKGRLVTATLLTTVMSLVTAACTQGRVEDSTTTTTGAPSVVASVPDYPPPPPAPIAVVVRRPGALGETLLGGTVDLGVHVLAENPIARIELWDGGELVATIDTAGVNDEEKALMSWIPATTGIHVALARAIDVNGLTAQAFPVWFRVIDAVLPPAPSAGLPRPSPVLSAASGPLLAAPAGLAALPEAPGIQINQGDCSITVDVKPASGAGGIALWGAILGGPGIVPMAVVGSQGGKLKIPARGLPQFVYIEPYNRAGSVPSVPAWIPAVDSCKDGDLTGNLAGDIHFENGILITSTQVDRVYLYGSRDGSLWTRLPGGDHSFIYAGPRGFDFSNLLPDPGPERTYRVEAWGWRGGELLWLGRAEYSPNPPPANAPPPILGTGSFAMVLPASNLLWVEKTAIEQNPEEILSLGGTLCTYSAASAVQGSPGAIPIYKNCDRQLGKETFRLSDLPPGADGAFWQVSSLAPPEGPSLDFLGMLAYGSAPEGDFPIDLASIVDPPPAAKTADDPNQSKYQSLQQVALGGGAKPSGSGQTFYAPTNPVLPSSLKPMVLFVRVVPTIGGQPLEGVSNVVKFDLVHEPPNEIAVYKVKYKASAEITEPGLPNKKWLRCVRIIDNPFPFDLNLPPSQTPKWVEDHKFNIYSQTEAWYGAFPTAPDGATLCGYKPAAPEKGIFDYIADAITFVGYVWDQFVSLYDMAKSAIVDALLFITQCDQVASKAACETIANTGLNIALSAIGIPPTLPSFKEAAEALKGDLVGYLAAEALKTGPCGTLETLCDQVAEKMFETLIDQIQQHVTESLTNTIQNQGYIFALHPGIDAIPEPAGTLHGATVRLTLTRPSLLLTPPSLQCLFYARVEGQVQHDWYDWDQGKDRSEVVTGEPFAHASGTIDMSNVAPGKTKTVFLDVPEWVDWYLPGHNNSDWQTDKFHPEGWIFFEPGAVITVTVESPCFSPISKSFVQDGLSHNPEDIPVS